MKGLRWMATAALVAGTLLAPAAYAADENAELRAKMAELMRKQAEMQQEMDELRQKLEAAPPAEVKVEEVERKQNVIVEEVRKLKENLSLPETTELKSEYGLGPAASKVYGVKSGLSLGSYGEFNYKNVVSNRGSSNDEFDLLRIVLYTGYRFTDRILFNSEIEFEHADTTKRGAVEVEFANLDFLLHEMANVRAGLVLVPMGFINEIHEPPFYHGNVRPIVENSIIPTTWRAGGVGLFGQLLPGLSYRTYAITGLNARGFTSSGIRGGRQSGSFERAEDFAWVGRLDYSPLEMLTFGGSAYVGNSGQDQSYGGEKPDVLTQIYEGHAQLRTHGFEARALGAYINIDDADQLSLEPTMNPHVTDATKKDAPIAGEQFGWYAEVAYNVLPLFLDTEQYLAPWFRYSQIDTQHDIPAGFTSDENLDREAFEVGLSWKPIPQVVLKADYRNLDADLGHVADEVRLGAGYAY